MSDGDTRPGLGLPSRAGGYLPLARRGDPGDRFRSRGRSAGGGSGVRQPRHADGDRNSRGREDRPSAECARAARGRRTGQRVCRLLLPAEQVHEDRRERGTRQRPPQDRRAERQVTNTERTTLNGGAGHDVLIGGNGAEVLNGRSGTTRSTATRGVDSAGSRCRRRHGRLESGDGCGSDLGGPAQTW